MLQNTPMVGNIAVNMVVVKKSDVLLLSNGVTSQLGFGFRSSKNL